MRQAHGPVRRPRGLSPPECCSVPGLPPPERPTPVTPPPGAPVQPFLPLSHFPRGILPTDRQPFNPPEIGALRPRRKPIDQLAPCGPNVYLGTKRLQSNHFPVLNIENPQKLKEPTAFLDP